MTPADIKFAKPYPVATLLKLSKRLPVIKAELVLVMPVGRRDKPSKVRVVAVFGDGMVAKGLGRTFASAPFASLTHIAYHLMRKHVEREIGTRIKLFEPARHEFANDHTLLVCINYFATIAARPPVAKPAAEASRSANGEGSGQSNQGSSTRAQDALPCCAQCRMSVAFVSGYRAAS